MLSHNQCYRCCHLGILAGALLLATHNISFAQQSTPRLARLPDLNPVVETGAPRIAPLESDLEEVEPDLIEPTWTEPWACFVCWEGSFEVGINASTGNSETFSIRAGGDLERETDRHKFKLHAAYSKTDTSGAVTQDNGQFWIRDDLKFGDSPWSTFLKGGIEYDTFRDYDYRLSGNGGLGYKFLDNDVTSIAARFGAGASQEIGSLDNDVKPEAVFGIDFKRQLTKRQKLTSTVDYYPTWDDWEDYRMEAEVAWEMLIDAEANLNLKFAVIDRYDSTPGTRKPNDFDYALLLLWKL